MRNRTPMFQTLLLALCLALGVAQAPLLAQTTPGAAPAATTLLVPAAWQLEGGSQWQGASLQVGASPVDNIVHTATRPVTLPAGASWRASLTLAAVKPEAADAALGLTLHGADGSFIGVMLRPARARPHHHSRQQAGVDDVAAAVVVPGMTDDANAPHTLLVGKPRAARLTVSVDGQEVGRGAVFDLEPVRVGVRTSRGQALVQALTLEATGVDERLARLAGARVRPAPCCCCRKTSRPSSPPPVPPRR